MAKEVKLSDRVHGADTKASSKMLNIDESEIIDFSSNVNIFTSQIDFQAIFSNITTTLNKYPDINYEELRNTLSNIYNVKSSNIIPGNGATELIYLIMKLPQIEKIGIFHPTFCEYERAAKISGKNPVDLSFDLLKQENEALLQNAIEDLDMVVICNPNNPTGEIKNLSKLIDIANKNSTLVFVDETFIDFTDNKEYSMLGQINNYNNVIILKAITKFYAMPGARLGYIFTSNENLIDMLWQYKEPWTINVFAEQLVKHLQTEIITSKTHYYYKDEIKRLISIYEDMNVKTKQSVTNYLLLRLPTGFSGTAIKAVLLKNYKLLIRTCTDFRGLDDTYIRIAIKDSKSNTLLANAIRQILCMEVI